jgi:ADP-heptose:LPS heptosyltransferase|uniref:Glycosyltransferase family 9 protein n=1 Tax=Desulfobacca acetoxidans TaxID=60893 RepID=A0A7V6A5X4_9BACT
MSDIWHKFLLTASKAYLRRAVRRRPPRPLQELDVAGVCRVLLLNATALGDLLFSTPVFRALKETYPHWQVDVLVHPRYQDLAAPNPNLSRLWLYPGRGWGLFSLMRHVRQQQYDLVVILHGNDPEATLIAWAAGTPFLIGSAKSPLAFAYAATVSHPDPLEHAIERRLAYARLVGADTSTRHLDLPVPAPERQLARDILVQHFGSLPDVLVALHPTGSAPYKWWPQDRYADLGRFIQDRYQAPILIISGKKDRSAAAELAARLPGPTLVTGGRYPLLTVAGLLSHCRLLVANDSGPLHMALALGVPTIALLGADHPARIGPYQVEAATFLYAKDSACPEPDCLTRRCPDNRCLKAITTQEVITTIQSWWEPHFGVNEKQ